MYRLCVIAQVSPPSELHEGVEQTKEKPQYTPSDIRSESREVRAMQNTAAQAHHTGSLSP